MKCLSDEQIQMLIDGEIEEEPGQRFEKHLRICRSCMGRFEEQQRVSQWFMHSINSGEYKIEKIPEFVAGAKMKKQISSTLFRILVPLAAASILLVFLSLPLKKNHTEPQYIIMYSDFEGEIDANLPVSEQQFTLKQAFTGSSKQTIEKQSIN